jgi:hypothetical protein
MKKLTEMIRDMEQEVNRKEGGDCYMAGTRLWVKNKGIIEITEI